MDIHCFFLVLLIGVFPFAFSANLPKNNTLTKVLNVKFKLEIDLEVFSDIKEVKKNESDIRDEVINVCGNENGDTCRCHFDIKFLLCNFVKLQTLNIRPIFGNFTFERFSISGKPGKNETLTMEKGKIFPGNEKTINVISIFSRKIIKIDKNIFDNLTSLKSLRFFQTTFETLNENILSEKLGKVLINLELENAEMTSMNLSIFKNLVNLENLSLKGNKQINGKFNEKFPKSLSNLKNLTLNFCNLTDLNDDTFEHLKSLETLHMVNNNITSIPSAIKALLNLKMFSFDQNKIEKVTENDFATNVKLEYLYLSSNYKLKVVENCAFCNLKNLKKVKFEHCHSLSSIDENAFGIVSNGFAPKLEEFNIHECNISVLHENLLDWKNVEKLILFKNPLSCNCSMAWLFNDLISKNSIYEEKLIPSYYVMDYRYKFMLGCLGPKPTTPNYTIPFDFVEKFSSCENASVPLKIH